MNESIIYTAEIRSEESIVAIRQMSKRLTHLLGFSTHDQTRIATAASEIIRNAYEYAGGGKVDFIITATMLLMRVRDHGRGIPHLESIMNGAFVSSTGMGMGILGAKRLMDTFEIISHPGQGTEVTFGKKIPVATLPRLTELIQSIPRTLQQSNSQASYHEIWDNNQELMQALDELQKRQDDLNYLNQELEDTNRGVVALYAELEEKAHQVQQASDMKSRFISNISHEFRTPLNTIRGLAGMLLQRLDGPLTSEQEKQVSFIRKSADDLMDMVNDLLDLAKIESGKITVKPDNIDLNQFFSALRGMMKPLHTKPTVAFIIESAPNIPSLYTDEGKLSQILRNLLSNAFKFTEQGEIRLKAIYDATKQNVTFLVSDTGLGIAPSEQNLIFEEFTQIPNALQKYVKGTGLGLPLSRKLAELLDGSLTVESQAGVGSTFKLTIPLIYGEAITMMLKINKVLIVDDSEASRYILKSFMKGYTFIELEDGDEALSKARTEKPDVIFLDLSMPGISGFEVLARLKADPNTDSIPVIIYTNKVLTAKDQEYLTAHQVVAQVVKEFSEPTMMRNQIIEALEKAAHQ